MKKSFSARRVPRAVGQEDDEPLSTGTESEGGSGMLSPQNSRVDTGLTVRPSPRSLTDGAEPALKRPTFKPRKGTTLRKSFGPTAVEDEDEDGGSGVVTPKRQGLSRVTNQRKAAKQTVVLPSKLSARQDEDDDRPSYSAASLQELKNSTPNTPRDLATDASASEVEDVEKSTQALDLSSKFGGSLSRYGQSSGIPSAAEIEEKKARRARLAREQAAEEFISLDPDDPQLDEDEDENVMRDERGQLVLKPKDKYGQAESRLVRDDEDVMENFDEFTEADGKILLGGKAEAEAARKRKQEMAAQIAAAEGSGSDSDDSNASERERNEAFEAAQTKHGTYAENATSSDPYATMRPRTPPKITPLPTLDVALERLRAQVRELQTSRMAKMKEMDALQKEKVRLGEEEVRIQRQLKETGEWYAKLRAEKGIEGERKMIEEGGEEDEGMVEDADADADADEGPSGLGFGSSMSGAGLGFGAAGAGLGFDAREASPATDV